MCVLGRGCGGGGGRGGGVATCLALLSGPKYLSECDRTNFLVLASLYHFLYDTFCFVFIGALCQI